MRGERYEAATGDLVRSAAVGDFEPFSEERLRRSAAVARREGSERWARRSSGMPEYLHGTLHDRHFEPPPALPHLVERLIPRARDSVAVPQSRHSDASRHLPR